MSTFHCRKCHRPIFHSEHWLGTQVLWDLTDYRAECHLISEAIDPDSLRRYDCSLHEGWYCCQFIMMRMVADKFGTGNHLLVYTDSVIEVPDGEMLPPPAHASNGVIRLTHRDFDAVIHNQEWEGKPDTLVVVKFGAIWCPPCRLMDKVFARIREKNRLPWVRFFEVDIDEEPELAGRWHFQSIPFTLFFRQGRPVECSDPKYECSEGGLLGGLTETEFVRLCESLRETAESPSLS
jgi:thiol-disulfide isomerase/thioredoxin